MTGQLDAQARITEEAGFEVIARLDLKPGRYQLRVAAELVDGKERQCLHRRGCAGLLRRDGMSDLCSA
jgi:hypothetical protein